MILTDTGKAAVLDGEKIVQKQKVRKMSYVMS